jgi:ABC-2 type transport system permease protein
VVERIAGMFEELRLLLYLNRLMVKQHLSLVFDWWMSIVGMVFEQGTALAFLGVIFYRIDAIKGWSLHEMIFLLGLFVLSKPVYRIFLQGVIGVSDMILNGRLDQILIRPRNPIVLILTSQTNPVAVGDIALGTALVIYAGGRIEMSWTLWRVAYMIGIAVCGSFVYVGTLLLKGALCVFVVRLEAMNALLQQFQQYAKYPVGIYHPIIKVMLVSILPYGLASSIPAAVLLHKGGVPWIGWLAPPGALCYMLVMAAALQWCLRFYKSSGS